MISFFIYTFIPLVLGIIVSLLSDVGSYNILNKPFLSPPSIVFPIVWTILYILLGYSSYITRDDKKYLKLFYINLAINLIWTFVFFNLGNYLQGFILIIFMVIIQIILLLRYFKTNKKAFWINLVYTIWLLYAAYLSIGVYILNQ